LWSNIIILEQTHKLLWTANWNLFTVNFYLFTIDFYLFMIDFFLLTIQGNDLDLWSLIPGRFAQWRSILWTIIFCLFMDSKWWHCPTIDYNKAFKAVKWIVLWKWNQRKGKEAFFFIFPVISRSLSFRRQKMKEVDHGISVNTVLYHITDLSLEG